MFVTSNAIDGLKYYLLPDFSKFNFTVFSQAATQVLFSVGIGNIIVPPRFGLLSNIKLPWLDASGITPWDLKNTKKNSPMTVSSAE